MQLFGYVLINEVSLHIILYTILRSVLGHVGDGNFHVILVLNPKNLEEIERVREFGATLAKYEIIELIFIIFIDL